MLHNRFLNANDGKNTVQGTLNSYYAQVRPLCSSDFSARVKVVRDFCKQIQAPYKLLYYFDKQIEILRSLSTTIDTRHTFRTLPDCT